jgi:hypothetical protein
MLTGRSVTQRARSPCATVGISAPWSSSPNLVDPDVYLRSGAPHEQFTWLREHALVFWVRRWRETWLARRSPMAASASRLT